MLHAFVRANNAIQVTSTSLATFFNASPAIMARMDQSEEDESDLPPIWWLRIYWSLGVLWAIVSLGVLLCRRLR